MSKSLFLTYEDETGTRTFIRLPFFDPESDTYSLDDFLDYYLEKKEQLNGIDYQLIQAESLSDIKQNQGDILFDSRHPEKFANDLDLKL
jgi:hypothetical protein